MKNANRVLFQKYSNNVSGVLFLDGFVFKHLLTSLAALILGMQLGVVYDVFKILRIIGLNSKIATFFEDIIFFLVSTVSFFWFYMNVTEGKFRIYPVLVAVLGFFIYEVTLGKVVVFLMKKIVGAIKKAVKFLYKKLFYPIFSKISFLFYKLFSPIMKFLKNFFQNIIKISKNLLPKTRKMLYNVKWNEKREGERKKNEYRRRESAKERFFS